MQNMFLKKILIYVFSAFLVRTSANPKTNWWVENLETRVPMFDKFKAAIKLTN